MKKEIEIPEGYEARIEDGKVIIEPKESEDERIRREIIGYLEHRADVTAFISESEDCKRWAAYLERQKEQKQAEWGEEDKGNLLDVQTIIDQVWHNQDAREWIERSDEELESLWHWLNNIWQKVAYPQPHWKPTEEQIGALCYAYTELFKRKEVPHHILGPLSNLIDNLRKL